MIRLTLSSLLVRLEVSALWLASSSRIRLHSTVNHRCHSKKRWNQIIHAWLKAVMWLLAILEGETLSWTFWEFCSMKFRLKLYNSAMLRRETQLLATEMSFVQFNSVNSIFSPPSLPQGHLWKLSLPFFKIKIQALSCSNFVNLVSVKE